MLKIELTNNRQDMSLTPAEEKHIRDTSGSRAMTGAEPSRMANAGVQTPAPVNGRIQYQNGQPVVSGNKLVTAIASPVRSDRITINGVETTKAAAQAAGFIDADGNPVGEASQNQPGKSEPGKVELRLPGTGEDDGKAAESDNDGDDDVPEATAKMVSEAGATIDAAMEQHGQDRVLNVMAAIAEEGTPDLEPLLADMGPDAPAQVHKAYQGFVASAEHHLGKAGASINMLSALQDDALSREARKATVSGDVETLSRIGGETVTRLASLPENDPASFADLIASSPEAGAVSTDANGVTTITLDDGRKITWAEAVRSGRIRF